MIMVVGVSMVMIVTGMVVIVRMFLFFYGRRCGSSGLGLLGRLTLAGLLHWRACRGYRPPVDHARSGAFYLIFPKPKPYLALS